MKLPNADRAVVDETKLSDYCLNPHHEEGRHKARVFKSALGLERGDASWLRQQLLRAVLTGEAETVSETKFGKLFMVDFVLNTRNGSAIVRSGWIVRAGENFPRLTTCFVKGKL